METLFIKLQFAKNSYILLNGIFLKYLILKKQNVTLLNKNEAILAIFRRVYTLYIQERKNPLYVLRKRVNYDKRSIWYVTEIKNYGCSK